MSTTADKQRQNTEARTRSLANLKPFPKGTSGNPFGRPKVVLVSEALRAQLAEKMQGASDSTLAEAVARALIAKAIKGALFTRLSCVIARAVLPAVKGTVSQS